MAATITTTKLNSPYSGPFVEGSRKCCYANLVLSGTYVTGGFSLGTDLETLFGIRWVGQAEVLRINVDSAVAALSGCEGQWDAATQKMVLYADGNTGNPAEVANATALGSVRMDVKFYTQGQG